VKRMRFLVATLIVWLFLFYNVERLSRSFNITGAAYLFVPMVAMLTLLAPPLRRIPLWGLQSVSIATFLMLKIAGGFPWKSPLPLTVTEVCITVLTVTMARWVSDGLDEFEKAVDHISIGQVGKSLGSFSTGQVGMYREMRRARHYQRPLSLMAVSVEEGSIQIAVDRMVQETQHAMMRQYVLSSVAGTLGDVLEDYNIIAQDNSHFLILMPEVSREQLDDLIGGLRQLVSEQIGVTLQVGIASFPDDAMTFDSLTEKAVKDMKEKQKSESSVNSSQSASEHRTLHHVGERQWS
jgi:GGDEF domain-containing protein